MRNLVLMVCFLISTAAMAATDTKNQPTASKSSSTTEHNFEDMLVQGKFHFSDEAVTTVEEDKVLDSLIGVRKDFKDRLLMSTTQF